MQVFELYFNPEKRDDRYFNSFSFEPENSFEKSLGNLYLIGELENATPQNNTLIEKISKNIRKKYYDSSFKKPNKALAESLKFGNNFLSEEIKKENVNWLGNLNFAVLAAKDFDLSFTATGSLKILLLRSGQINDISKDLNATEIEPYPLKVFFNVVSGKLFENDIILAVSKDLFDFLNGKKIFEKIADSAAILSEKRLKEIIPVKIFEEADELNISGICTIIDFAKNHSGFSSKAKEIVFKKAQGGFLSKSFEWLKSIKAPKLASINVFRNLLKSKNKKHKILPIPKKEKKISILAKTKKLGSGINLKLPSTEIFSKYAKSTDSRKNIILIITLALILVFGFALFKKSAQIKNDKEAVAFSEIIQKYNEAKNELNNNNNKKAEELLKEILGALPQFMNNNSPKSADAAYLKNSVEEDLYKINKIKRIDNPAVLTDIDIKNLEFVPQTLLISGYQMYLTSSISPNLYVFDLNSKKGGVFNYTQNLELSDDSSSIILFFSRPNKIITFSSNKFKEEKIELPKNNFAFDLMCSYASNIYFLDQEKNEIMKYSYTNNFKWSSPKISFEPKEKAKSMALDSYFWLLNENNGIDIYYKGEYQKTLDISIFPEIKGLTKIKTKAGLPYLYLLEPANNRLIITDKNGKLIEQIQSEKFDNLKDFSISYNGSTIWILNGEQIFQIEM